MYICTSHYFWSLPWCSSQDFISITLMNGRALLPCVVGVSGLLDKEGEQNFVRWSTRSFWIIMVNTTQECCEGVCGWVFTCKQSLACCYWTEAEDSDLPGSTPCGHAFLGSVDGKGRKPQRVTSRYDFFLLQYECFNMTSAMCCSVNILQTLHSKHKYES